MHAGFEYYRAFPQDAIDNQNYSKTNLTMPVLAPGGRIYSSVRRQYYYAQCCVWDEDV